MSGGEDEVLAHIQKALDDWERRGDAARWVPEKYLPEQPIRRSPSSYSERIEDLMGTTLHEMQRMWLDRLERGEFSILPIGRGRPYSPDRLRSEEETRERMKLVRGPGVDMVLIDEAVLEPDFFSAAPLFGRQDAGLDDLEPEGPVWEPTERYEDGDHISIWTGMPAPSPHERLKRLLRFVSAWRSRTGSWPVPIRSRWRRGASSFARRGRRRS